MNLINENDGTIKLLTAIEYLRNNVNKDLPIQQIALFLNVILYEGLTIRELSDKINQHISTVSRSVRDMSDYVVEINGQYVTRGCELFTPSTNKYKRREDHDLHSDFLR